MITRSDVVQMIRDTLGTLVFQTRRGTTEQWAASTRPLKPGEQGWNSTTKQMYVGDGVKLYPFYDVVGTGVVTGGATGSGLTQAQIQDLINTSINGITFPPSYVLPNSVVQAVTVLTGNEARPNASVVLWVGGSEKPLNMQDQDVHLAEEPADLTAPTTPTGLAVSAATTTGFTVSWTPSSDAIGVTGYEVRLNGGTAVAKTTNSHTFTSLAENTTYTVEVRARDAAGNFSSWASISGATLAPNVMRNFFAPAYMTEMKSQPDWSPTVANDPGGIELASIFWSAGSGAKPFLVHGVRLYTPSTADSAYMNGNVTARLYAREYVSDPVDVSSFPTLNSEATKSATYSAPRTPDSWVDILFDSPVQINPAVGGVQDPGDDLAVISIQMDSGSYMAVSFTEIDAFLAAHSTTPGNSGAMINSPHGDSVKWPASSLRSAFQQGANNWQPGTNWYGVDLIYTVVG